ncbi:septum formation initiator [Salinisphaera sp. PC39]|uniref:septum formation initiator family protein n=1 Tax=Salinisphaera sp. PC39 TaxID=1304156 RepID=UPI00333FB2BE
MYRFSVIALVLVFGGLQYRLWIADGGYAEIHRLQQDIDAVTAENAERRTRNEALEAEIADLKSGEAAMEGRARSDLGMIRDGEDFFLIVDSREGGEP